MEKGIKGCMAIWVFRAWRYKDWYGLCEQYWAITSALSFSTSYFNYQTLTMWGWFQSRTKIKAVVNVQAPWKTKRKINCCFWQLSTFSLAWFGPCSSTRIPVLGVIKLTILWTFPLTLLLYLILSDWEEEINKFIFTIHA